MKHRCFVLLWDEFSFFFSKLGFIPLDNIKELRKTEEKKERNFSHGIFRGWIQFICFALLFFNEAVTSGRGQGSLVFLFIATSRTRRELKTSMRPCRFFGDKKREKYGRGCKHPQTRIARENLFYAFHKRFKRRHVCV